VPAASTPSKSLILDTLRLHISPLLYYLDGYPTSNQSFITTIAAMWDDEDNNPYGSFARHDSNASDAPGLASPTARKTLKHYPKSVADL
jgi:hypothetical protein